MDYKLIIDDSTILSGNFWIVFGAIFLVIAITAGIINILWRRNRSIEIMRYEFITMIAHKFRTPLTSIKWLLENMLTDETDSYKRESLTGMKISNEKLVSLTGTLIELTDQDNKAKADFTWEDVNYYDFVKSITDTYTNSFHEKNIAFSLQCADPDLKVTIDRSRLEFVIQTLLENAHNYTSSGRRVDVILGKDQNRAVLAVSDSGIGIDKVDIPKIFAKFFRTNNARQADTEGIGVGLYLANSIVRRHHGRLTVDSAGIDLGSTFTLILPLTK